MRTALCLGGAACLWDDIERCPVPFDGVVACNDAGANWPGELDAWVTLHANKFRHWEAERQQRSFPKAKALYSHRADLGPKGMNVTGFQIEGTITTGSSGLFMIKVALEDLEFDRVVICGVPMLPQPHFFDNAEWRAFETYRKVWPSIARATRGRMRSMSGWTRLLLGPPEDFI